MQTVPFTEVRVYDDASPDDTSEIAASFGASVIRGRENRGCSHGKNVLARETTCEWLHFHDADDELKPDFVERALSWTQRSPAPDVVFFSYETRFNDTGDFNDFRHFDAQSLRTDPLGYVLAEQINPFCGLYRREPFLQAGGWDEDPSVLQSEDQAGHLRLALAGLSFDADSAVTVINYIREGSMTTSNLPGANRATYFVMEKALRHSLRPEHREIVARRLWKIAGAAAAYGDWKTADEAGTAASRLSPPSRQDNGRLLCTLARVNPKLALRIRERLIRWFKPSSRSARVYRKKSHP